MNTNDLSTIKTAFISAIINKYNNPKKFVYNYQAAQIINCTYTVQNRAVVEMSFEPNLRSGEM